MPDITTISTILSSLKAATDIAKLIKDSGTSLEGAEAKLQMAELVSTLADVKLELADVQDVIRKRDQKIAQLKSDLSQKSATKFDGQMYWMDGDETPFCAVCLEKELKYHHLTLAGDDGNKKWWCRVCANMYNVRNT